MSMTRRNLNSLVIKSFFISLMLILGACGAKQNSSKVALSFKLGAIVSSQAVSGGGMVYGQDATGGGRWAQAIPAGATSFSREMDNGNWNFQMIAWEGASPLTGTVRCASVSGVSLEGNPKDVALTLSTAGCDSSFTNATYTADATYGIAPLRLVGCTNLQGVSTPSDNCNSPLENIGMSQSYRVVMMSYQGGVRVEGLSSTCISHSNLFKHKKADSVYFTDLRIPMGGSNPALDIRIKGFEDENCTSGKIKRDYDFTNGFAIDRPALGLAADNFRSADGVDHIVKVTTNPYGSGSYTTTQSNYMAVDVEYIQGWNGMGCNCSALPAALQAYCTQDSASDAGSGSGYSNCPSVNSSVVNFVGSGFGGGTEVKCFSDHSNNNGPNCDAGTVNIYRVSCRADGVSASNPLICEVKGSDSVSCGGEGPSCRFGGSAPQFVSLYLADNIFGAAGTPFMAQAPTFECSGGHCIPIEIVDGSGSGSGSGSGNATQTEKDSAKYAVAGVLGTFNGEKSYKSNNLSCISPSIINVTNTGSGSGSGSSANYTVYWRMPTSTEIASCNNSSNDGNESRLELGKLGDIRSMLIGDGVGGFLWREGFTTCSAIPTSGSSSTISFVENGQEKSFYIDYEPGDINMAFGTGTGGGGFFEKKITLVETTPGTLASVRWIYQYNCSSNLQVGYVWGNWDEYDNNGDLRLGGEEVYYNTDNVTSAKIEYVTTETKGDEKDYRIRVRAEKLNSNEYAIWQSRVEGTTNNYGSGSGGSGSGSNPGGILPPENVGNIPGMSSGPGKMHWNGSNTIIYGNTNEARITHYSNSFFGNITKPRLPFVQLNGNITVYTNDYTDNGLIYDFTATDTPTPTAIVTGSGFQSDVDNNGSGTYGQFTANVLVNEINTSLGGSGVYAFASDMTNLIFGSGVLYFANGVPANSILPGDITINLQSLSLSTCVPFGNGVTVDINAAPMTVFNAGGCNITVANPSNTSTAAQPIYMNGTQVDYSGGVSTLASSCFKYNNSGGGCSVSTPIDINLGISPLDNTEFSVDWLLDTNNLP